MKPFELVSGIIALVIVAAIGVWVLIVRQYKKQELTLKQRMYAGIALAVALALLILGMPVALWAKIVGLAFAVVMLVSSIYQSGPKYQERLQARLKQKAKDKDKDKSKQRRTVTQDYAPYYKQRQQKRKRSK